MTVRIVTDSACDLTDDEVATCGVEVVSLSIRFGEEEFIDRTELPVSEFYRRLAASPVLPETAAPAPGAFAQAYERLQADGASAIVSINLSSELSATMQSAQTAASAFSRTAGARRRFAGRSPRGSVNSSSARRASRKTDSTRNRSCARSTRSRRGNASTARSTPSSS